MFQIRRIYDDTTTANRELLTQVQAILRAQFPGLRQGDCDKLPDQLRNPLKHRFRCILFVAEQRGSVCGFALLLHAPDLHFCYLDFVSAAGGETGRGIGGALYDRVRENESYIRAVHDGKFVSFLKRACANVQSNQSVYPYVFPIRNTTRPPKQLPLRAGYYCIDTFTPLNGNAFKAAIGAVDCALTGAQSILAGKRAAYALVRPPGHHAERRVFGGFCYFNSASVAAHELSRFGKVALLDIDYHHGNGSQDIFWDRSDVLTISTHGNPRLSYPYFSGFEDEIGEGQGKGYNLNIPLPENIDGARFRKALGKALARIKQFEPRFLVISLGLDTARGDPTGSWTLGTADFAANGRLLGELGLPTLIVQEGGYRTRTLGVNARHFFVGFADGAGLSE